MRLSDFDYDLPSRFIAQNPAHPRDSARLLVFHSKTGKVEHKIFRDVTDYLKKGDVLVLNKSKVIKARIRFKVGGKNLEIFLLREIGKNKYLYLVKPGKKFKKGSKFKIKDAEGKIIESEVLEVNEDGSRVVQFSSNFDPEKLGEAPFPPYIKHSTSSLTDYQTVYAKEKGSTASPTAGLHFTNELLKKIEGMGCDIEKVLLHVGLGTFLPVRTEKIEDHKMHFEFFEFTPETALKLNKIKGRDGRIIAVGTTSVRVLESCFKNGKFTPQTSETNIFIYPGYKWGAVDALITNFHLPKSTLIMLVASFLEHKGVKNGTKKILELYEIAKKNDYRFYSFGDAMMVV